MGVITQADVHRQQASQKLNKVDIAWAREVQKQLESMIDPEVWGGNEWHKDFKKKIKKDIKYLNRLQDRIVQMKNRY